MQTTLAPLEILATNEMFTDPAIDMSDPDDPSVGPSAEDRLAEYRRTRDMSALALKPDVAPTVFVCKRLQPVLAARALDTVTQAHARLNAFIFGCHEIRTPDVVMKPKKLAASAFGASTPADENEWVNAVAARFGLSTIHEIGQVIYERARLPEAAKGPFSYRAG